MARRIQIMLTIVLLHRRVYSVYCESDAAARTALSACVSSVRGTRSRHHEGSYRHSSTSRDCVTMTALDFRIRKNDNNNQESKFHLGSRPEPGAALGAWLWAGPG